MSALISAARGLLDHVQDKIEADIGRECRSRDLPPAWHKLQRALAAGASCPVREAATAMKAAWDADFAQRDLVLAACFAGAAHEAALTSSLTADAAPAALLRAFLTALIDPMSADLDYLRANPASGEAARSDGPETTA